MENQDTKVVAETTTPALPKAVKLNFQIPDVKEFLKTGAQFGHQSKRWNPKMAKYIFTKRGNIHIIDLGQTLPLLEEALKFLVTAASKGEILFVATKRQAGEIVKKAAIESGSYYIIHRWPGGFFTNKGMIKRSLGKLAKFEEELERGVEGRTKYEVSKMKKDWQRLNRLYEGVKKINNLPKAIVVVDPNYEKKSIREARQLGIPVVALIDTNCDPEGIQYPIPANDDAVKSVQLIVDLFVQAIKQGNEGKGIVHDLKDYSKLEVKLIKPKLEKEEDTVEMVEALKEKDAPVRARSTPAAQQPTKRAKSSDKVVAGEEKGLLGRSRDNAKLKIKKKD